MADQQKPPRTPTPDQQRPDQRQGKPQNPHEKRQDELLDESVEETFPASDPISPKQIT